MSHDVFISYASDDKTVADAACAKLESLRLRCWIAPRDVLPGVDYGESIVRAIEDSRLMVLVFSGRSNTSDHVKNEVERAVSAGKPIVPLRVEDVMPAGSLALHLSRRHWLDALTPPLERHLSRLGEAVQALLSIGAFETERPGGAGVHAALEEATRAPHGPGDAIGNLRRMLRGRPAWALASVLLIGGFAIAYGLLTRPASEPLAAPAAGVFKPPTAATRESESAAGFAPAFRELRQTDGYTIRSIAFESRGRMLASGGDLGSNGYVEVWDALNGRLLRSLPGRATDAVAFSSDGSRLFAAIEGRGGIDDGEVMIWSTSDWQVLKTLEGAPHHLSALAISPNSELVAGAGVEIWQTRPVRRLRAPGYLTVWSLPAGDVKWTVETGEVGVYAVAFAPDGAVLVSGSDDGVTVWDPGTGAGVRRLQVAKDGLGRVTHVVAFSPRGDLLATGHSNGTVTLWDTKAWTAEWTTKGDQERVTAVAFAPDGSALATAGWDRIVELWDLTTHELLLSLPHDEIVSSLSFSPDGRVLACGGYEDTIRLWTLSPD